eukprot:scaffold1026_cov141-Skeletonema_menzelii.AAC.1
MSGFLMFRPNLRNPSTFDFALQKNNQSCRSRYAPPALATIHSIMPTDSIIRSSRSHSFNHGWQNCCLKPLAAACRAHNFSIIVLST